MSVLADAEISKRVADELPGWTIEGKELVRTYETGDWRMGMLLAGMIGYLAEAANHHPDLLLTYPRVTVRLSSHDVGGITERDLDLAGRIEQEVNNRPDRAIHTHAPKEWIR